MEAKTGQIHSLRVEVLLLQSVHEVTMAVPVLPRASQHFPLPDDHTSLIRRAISVKVTMEPK